MIQPVASSRRHLKSARQLLLPSIACALLVGAATSASFGVTLFSPTPSIVFTAASNGYNILTSGINSTSSPTSLILQGGNVLAGYETNNASSPAFRSVYSYTLGSSGPVIASFTDIAHYQTTGTPSLIDVSASGIIVGTQTLLDATGNYLLGTDVFESTAGTPTAIPVPTTVLGGGATYTYTYKSGGVAYGTGHSLSVAAGTTSATNFGTNAIGTNGIVVGTVTRYLGDSTTSMYSAGSNDGSDGFYYDPSTGISTAVGLTGGQYNYVSTIYGDPNAVNHGTTVVGAAGSAAVGFTYLNNPTGGRAGYDGWMYTPATGTVQIGLAGGAFTYTDPSNSYKYEFTQIYRTNAAGQIAGKSSYVSNTGDPLGDPSVAWLYTPSSAPGVASTLGTSSAGTYVQLGLGVPGSAPSGTTLGYTSAAAPSGYTNINFLNNNGTAAGVSNRYDTTGTYQGQSAYYYNGSTNVVISPLDSIHAAAAGGTVYSSNTVTAVNNSGMVAAYATRVAGTTTGSASLGQDAYIWDSKTSTRYFVDPADEAMGTSNYELSYIGVLGDNGLAVGYYNTYSGTATTVLSSVLFDWSEATGLQILNTYTGSSYASSMQAFVTSFKFGADGNLYGASSPLTASATALVEYSSARLLGDANLDGKVDLSDLNIVLNHLGTADLLIADGNFDGQPTIDLTDLNDVLNNLGTSSPSAAGTLTATPEPTSLSLLAAGTLLLTRRRKPKQI